jgi:diamine N-acetyltransferase
MTIALREIDSGNFLQCLRLKVAAGQENYVADNAVSVAELKIYPYLTPLAVYSDNETVGFTMYGRDPETGNFWLVRLMIDQKHQGKGYGKSATRAVIEKLNKEFGCQEVFLSFVPENVGAEKLYSGLGFERTGETDEDGEIIMRFKSTDNGRRTTDN